MQTQSLLMEGLNLLVLGMGFVFIFLIFLVYATRLMSWLVTLFLKHHPLEVTDSQSTPSHQESSLDDNQLVAIFAAAINQHRLKTSKSL